MGWTYYLLTQIINISDRNYLDLIINDASVAYVFSLTIIHFSTFAIVAIRLIKRKLISKKEFLITSLSGLSVTLLFLVVYHTNPQWLP